jgi:coenzyme F420-reducing hydrogenase alpha subunit
MTPEGRIAIDLFPERGSVTIASTRPLTIPRQFSGHRPEEVVRTVSLLFATCKAAQTIAAVEAFADAAGELPSGGARRVRALLVLAETAREHALRVLIDWPQFLRVREEPEAGLLRSLMTLDRELNRVLDKNGEALCLGGACESQREAQIAAIQALKALLEKAIFGEALDRWRERRALDDLLEWARPGRTAAQRLLHQIVDEDRAAAGAAEISSLPLFERDAIAKRLLAEDADPFIAQPTWRGAARETSPLARMEGHPLVEALKTEQGHGLGARLIACLAELSEIPERMIALAKEADAASEARLSRRIGDGIGVAQVEAARGRLVHAVAMDGGRVRRYRILAPTEWNFHPDGAVASGLRRIALSGGADCAMLARLFVTAADPCVSAEVRVH